MCACVSVSVSVWSQKVRRLDDSLLPRRLLPAGWWQAEGEGQALLLRSCALAVALVAAGQDGRQLLLALGQCKVFI